jgi:hypothetical protein
LSIGAAERLLDTLPATMVAVSTGGPPIKTVEDDYKRQYAALRRRSVLPQDL